MTTNRIATVITTLLASALLLSSCAASGQTENPPQESAAEPARDLGETWERFDLDFDGEGSIIELTAGAGRLWISVSVDDAGCDELQLWSSSDAAEWVREDLTAAGLPADLLCSLDSSVYLSRSLVRISGDDVSFTLALFLDESLLSTLGIPFEPQVWGAEWVVRFESGEWNSYSPEVNGLLERDAPAGFYDSTGPAVDSASADGATLFVAPGGWFGEGRTTGEAFHARLLDAEGVGTVIHGLREPFSPGPGTFRSSDFVTHTGAEWLVVGKESYGRDGIAVWAGANAQEWDFTLIPGPAGGSYLVEGLAHGSTGTVIVARIIPESAGDPVRAVVLHSANGREFDEIELELDASMGAPQSTRVSWVSDRFVVTVGGLGDHQLWQSFDGHDWNEFGSTVPYYRPNGAIVPWGSGWVAHGASSILTTGAVTG